MDISFEIKRLRAEIVWQRMRLAAQLFRELVGKANFDPAQPRVPRGNPTGGQWTKVGEGGAPPQPAERVPTIQIEDGEGSLLEIPQERPPKRVVFTYVKRIARWAALSAFRKSPIGRLKKVIDVASWVYDHYPTLRSYFDEPKSLVELQANVLEKSEGYEIHHIAEKASAYEDGYPASMVEGRENLVRIPKIKHWEITGWYMERNPDFGGLTPREYLRGKSWQERQSVGEMALKDYGVLNGE